MYLIIAEKRSAAEKVGSCIKGEFFKKGDGFIQSQNYYITWCAGHLYTLLDLEEYDPNYDLIKNISKIADGNGGGSAFFAQGGGTNVDKLDMILTYAKGKIEKE